MAKTNWLSVWCVVWLVVTPAVAKAQLDFEGSPIQYGKTEVSDRVAKLASQIDSGQLKLESDSKFGLLPAVLKALDVKPSTQTLVFSKTSFQLHKISPGRPRALYFNDDTYVGWVQGSEVIELASSDKDQGAVFYTLEPDAEGKYRVLRDQGQCLICHGSSRTQGVPGYLVRSVYSTPAGRFVTGSPTYVTDHSSPFSERWGGWYVTGTHGDMRHLGNVTCIDERREGWLDVEEGDNLLQLPTRVKSESYLQPGSDLVALMVLEHQSQMHNWLTRANYETRTAQYQIVASTKHLAEPRITKASRRRDASLRSEKNCCGTC